jgi:hypothetical protein
MPRYTVALLNIEPLGSEFWGVKLLEIVERSCVFSPQMTGPSGTTFSKATAAPELLALRSTRPVLMDVLQAASAMRGPERG